MRDMAEVFSSGLLAKYPGLARSERYAVLLYSRTCWLLCRSRSLYHINFLSFGACIRHCLHRIGLLHAHAASFQLEIIDRANGGLGLMRHRHIGKSEAFGATRYGIHDNCAGLNAPVFSE